jgi:hypothetical protein
VTVASSPALPYPHFLKRMALFNNDRLTSREGSMELMRTRRLTPVQETRPAVFVRKMDVADNGSHHNRLAPKAAG